MTDRELEELARSVGELKRAVKRNNPFLRSILASRGWGPLALFASLSISLFTLPAHFLSLRYGSFSSIPPLEKALLWLALGLFLVAGTIWKVLLLRRRAAEAGGGFVSIVAALFGGQGLHSILPLIIGAAAEIAFAFSVGHPWLSAPATAILASFWSNAMAATTDRRDYLLLGWWCLLSGSIGLFLVERAPFLWLFLIYGGLCYLFAAETLVAWLLKRGEADGKE